MSTRSFYPNIIVSSGAQISAKESTLLTYAINIFRSSVLISCLQVLITFRCVCVSAGAVLCAGPDVVSDWAAGTVRRLHYVWSSEHHLVWTQLAGRHYVAGFHQQHKNVPGHDGARQVLGHSYRQ